MQDYHCAVDLSADHRYRVLVTYLITVVKKPDKKQPKRRKSLLYITVQEIQSTMAQEAEGEGGEDRVLAQW